ncbi:MAG: Pr6Pr family membrane protein [Rhodobiaceae bacterium]|nr:Pr6Pr family membrane protein [Rhodobiaceae bacterium]
MSARLAAIAQFIGLVAGLFGLTVQFSISVPATVNMGWSVGGAIVWFFSYFTILTNILAVCVLVATVRARRHGQEGFLASPMMKGNVLVSITIVMLIYHFALASLWAPKGLFYLCDILLHYVAPVSFIVWWLSAGADGRTTWRDPFWWLIYPLAYGIYALVRFALTGYAPYPFLDASNGWGPVFANMANLLLVFMVLGGVAVLIDRQLMSKRRA